MDKHQKAKEVPVWPPPPTTAPQTQNVVQEKPSFFNFKNLAILALGFFCGIAFCLVSEGSLFIAFVKLQSFQLLNEFSSSVRGITFYGGKIVELASLSVPVFLYFWLRQRYFFFATGLLVGSILVMAIFFRLFFVGLR